MNVSQFAIDAVILFVALYAVAFIVFQTTELGKILTRWIAGWLPATSWIAIKGFGSYVFAFALAAIAAFYPGSGLSDLLTKLFAAGGITIDPLLVQLMTSFLTALFAAKMQDSGKMPSPLPSSKNAK